MRRRRFRRNEVIFHQGDIGDSLQVVAAAASRSSCRRRRARRRSSPASSPATSSASSRCSTAHRARRRRPRSSRPRRWRCRGTQFLRPARRGPAPRARAPPRAGRGAAPPDRPRRGAALPGPRRAPLDAARAGGAGRVAAATGRVELDWPYTGPSAVDPHGVGSQTLDRVLPRAVRDACSGTTGDDDVPESAPVQVLAIVPAGPGERPSISRFGMGVEQFDVDNILKILAQHGVTPADPLQHHQCQVVDR